MTVIEVYGLPDHQSQQMYECDSRAPPLRHEHRLVSIPCHILYLSY
jgi:hypothetical protein